MMMRRGSEMVIVPSPKPREATVICLIGTSFQTYASLEKMLHKAIFSIQQLKKKGNPTLLLHQNNIISNKIIGHYANKCQTQKPLVTLKNDKVETEPENEELSVPLPLFDEQMSQWRG
ncbi:hypothetical protein F2Q69_00021389 [Brassica cretica]|uniref:Uncharacterized protein n=1 Tax=Brassica cretica TaxID=69181 RepID=A0A8S9Q1G5_BRACR|nr:hypothetical protein F2Q69_00021389 [Brassica cretica]